MKHRKIRGTSTGQRRRSPLGWTVFGTAVALVGTLVLATTISALYIASLMQTLDANTTTLEDPFPTGERPAPDASGAKNILLMGSDARGDAAAVGDTEVADERSDALLLVHIDADRQNIYTMSLMRDSWVEIPGHGMAKLNAAFAWGGTPLTVATVEGLLGVRVDHVALIDFAGFAGMTDALGGVEVPVEVPFEREGFSYTAGTNRLTGEQALGFVRERYAFAKGDFQRVRNQQLFLKGIADTALNASTLTDPNKLSDFIAAASAHLSVDAGLDAGTLMSLGISLRDIRADRLHFLTVPANGSGTSEDGQQYVVLDPARLLDLQRALADDSIDRFLGLPTSAP